MNWKSCAGCAASWGAARTSVWNPIKTLQKIGRGRKNMIQVRASEERGQNKLSWLDTRFTFSFDQYYDPEHIQFRSLRVLNEDIVAPGKGFGMHPHRDMEILTWILDGSLEHRDSMGTGAVIRPGESQHMTAGSGIMRSEFNPSPKDPTHLLQIWIVPDQKNLKPEYEQLTFPDKDLRGQFHLVAGAAGAGDVYTEWHHFILAHKYV